MYLDWSAWEPLYREVATDLGLSIPNDYSTAEKYKLAVEHRFKDGCSPLISQIASWKKIKAWIFGAGPSLEQDFITFQQHFSSEKDLVVGVDGASLFLREKGYVPDLIFSDGDGSLDAILDCVTNGSILILHAHGDNYSIIDKLLSKIKIYTFIPTVQTKPAEPYLYNFGGFTDGDRAISAVLEWFTGITVLLVGFTFGNVQGRYSKPHKLKNHAEASEFKLKKLAFAKKYIAILAKSYPNQIFNLSKPTDSIQGVSESFF